MRTVFTESARRLLERWLENGEETGETRKLFTQIRWTMNWLKCP